MTDFKTILNDFSHLVSGMSSVAGGVRSEVEENVQTLFHTLVSQAGFVRRDEFDNLSDRFDQSVEMVTELQQKIDMLMPKNLDTDNGDVDTASILKD
ncbi:MAG: BMFP domain-containing protein YqiC [Alphaproteobacteria bacterium]|jgi:BMFP domain-containing protein YqiC